MLVTPGQGGGQDNGQVSVSCPQGGGGARDDRVRVGLRASPLDGVDVVSQGQGCLLLGQVVVRDPPVHVGEQLSFGEQLTDLPVLIPPAIQAGDQLAGFPFSDDG